MASVGLIYRVVVDDRIAMLLSLSWKRTEQYMASNRQICHPQLHDKLAQLKISTRHRVVKAVNLSGYRPIEQF